MAISSDQTPQGSQDLPHPSPSSVVLMGENSAGRVWVVFQYDLLLGAWTASYHVDRICFATRGTKNSKGWTRQWFQRYVVIVLPWKWGTKWFSDREEYAEYERKQIKRFKSWRGRARFDQRLADDFLFSPLNLGKIPISTNILQMGWNHQLVDVFSEFVAFFDVPKKNTKHHLV